MTTKDVASFVLNDTQRIISKPSLSFEKFANRSVRCGRIGGQIMMAFSGEHDGWYWGDHLWEYLPFYGGAFASAGVPPRGM